MKKACTAEDNRRNNQDSTASDKEEDRNLDQFPLDCHDLDNIEFHNIAKGPRR